MDKIKLAVLGLNQGSKIARDAKANPEIELVAVAGFGDHDVKVAEELGVPLYNDYTLLLKQEDLDAVAIALPNTLHVQSTELALAAGIKNILLEKPIANTVEEAEHIIKICNGTACHLRGSMSLATQLKNELGIDPGQTTEDGKFSVEFVNCLGSCALAPVMVVDGNYHNKLRVEQVKKIVALYADGERSGND